MTQPGEQPPTGEPTRSERPHLRYYDPEMPHSYEYPDLTMFELIESRMRTRGDAPAMRFQSTTLSAAESLELINRTAAALHHLGFRRGDVATLCLPNTPHAVIAFYAVQRLGGICSMVHPLMPGGALVTIMKETASEWLFTLDAFIPRMEKDLAGLMRENGLKKVVACAIRDYLNPLERIGFWIRAGRKIPTLPGSLVYIPWRTLMNVGQTAQHEAPYTELEVPSDPQAPAVYLQSGGTTGEPKSIVLSSANMNVLAVQGPGIVRTAEPAGMKMLSILPFFHGFGLCMQMHAMFVTGIICVLVPQFKPDTFADVMLKERTEFLVGVPTLFEGIMSSKKLEGKDLSFLRAIFCGGDSLPSDLKARFDRFLKDHGATVELREGYGLTETVNVCTVNPECRNVAGSVGLPLPDMALKIVEPGTEHELAPGEGGEICVSGPTVMLRYLNDPEATAETRRKHADGKIWIHTGDFGVIDEKGYVYYKSRLKRVIKVSGVAVFPAEIEGLLQAHPAVKEVSVIGVPHSYKIEVPFAFIALKKGVPASAAEAEAREQEILDSVRNDLLRHAIPRAVHFVDALPRTPVGKVDYRKLERIYDERDDLTVE